jgi:hypothetical protein
MTPQEEAQFKLFGCIPRCLIQLAERIQKPVTKEEFCNRFGHRFHNPKTQYGLLNPDFIPEIARALSLPGEKGTPPKDISFVGDYDQVATLHKTGSMVLVESQINLNEGATDPLGHCSVLHAIDAQTFTLWTPSQDGNDYIIPPFQRSAWAEKKCRGIVLI